jgi:hypothetical protein
MGNTIDTSNTHSITNGVNNDSNTDENTKRINSLSEHAPRVIERFYIRITRKVFIGNKLRIEQVAPNDEYIEMLLDKAILPSIAKTSERDMVIERVERSILDTLLVISSARNSTTRQFLISVLTKIQFKFSLDEEIGIEIVDDPILGQL